MNITVPEPSPLQVNHFNTDVHFIVKYFIFFVQYFTLHIQQAESGMKGAARS